MPSDPEPGCGDRGRGTDRGECLSQLQGGSLGVDGQVANMSPGYNWSVVFMLTVPFSLMGTGVFMIHRAVKRGMLPEM